MIKEIYGTPEERQALIDDYVGVQGKHIVAESNSEDEDSITFNDVPRPQYKNPEQEEYHKLQISTITPEQIDNYVENNVTDLESAKTVLKLYGKALIRVARKVGM